MTPEQCTRFNAGTPNRIFAYEASTLAYNCVMAGIETNNKALLESAEDISRSLRNNESPIGMDSAEMADLYACIVAATDAVMCSLPPNHPARQIDDEARRAMLHKEQSNPSAPLDAQIPQAPLQGNSTPARIPRARRLSPYMLIRRTRPTHTTTVIQ